MHLSKKYSYALILAGLSGFSVAQATSGGGGKILVPGSGGADRLSLESADPGGASRIARMAGGCALPTIWSNIDLGVPADGNVDAISFPFPIPGSGTGNLIPYRGPALGGTLAWNQVCNAGYTVDRSSMGPLGTVVNTEYLGNGAASDTFLVKPFNGPSAPTPNRVIQNSDGGDCLTPKGTGAFETDIDSMTGYFGKVAAYPVFYSVDASTIMSLPLGDAGGPLVPVSPADILVAESPGVAYIAVTEAALGLIGGDDIDALSVCMDLEHAVYSLTAPSPSAQLTYPVIGQLGGAGLYSHYFGFPIVVPWATPQQMGLQAPVGVFGTFAFVPGDELNGVRVGDPRKPVCLQ
jgi:hypothetical protein